MSAIPRLYTPRLCLRPFVLSDAPRLQELVGDKRIAQMTATIPHPYPEGAAEIWMAPHEKDALDGRQFTWAITLAGTRTPGREQAIDETGHLVGCIGIGQHGDPVHGRGMIGYWIGVPYWNKGFATEAARAVVRYAFGHALYHKIMADHFAKNPASGRVMQKLGMTCEGTLRQHFNKWGEYLDVVYYGILAEEWDRQSKPRKFTTRPE
jgi:ribosomal-protein-alanine N-acetyltransferase